MNPYAVVQEPTLSFTIKQIEMEIIRYKMRPKFMQEKWLLKSLEENLKYYKEQR